MYIVCSVSFIHPHPPKYTYTRTHTLVYRCLSFRYIECCYVHVYILGCLRITLQSFGTVEPQLLCVCVCVVLSLNLAGLYTFSIYIQNFKRNFFEKFYILGCLNVNINYVLHINGL